MILREVPDAKVLVCPVDVKDWRKVDEAVTKAIQDLGRLDVLIANAGAANSFDTRMCLRNLHCDEFAH